MSNNQSLINTNNISMEDIVSDIMELALKKFTINCINSDNKVTEEEKKNLFSQYISGFMDGIRFKSEGPIKFNEYIKTTETEKIKSDENTEKYKHAISLEVKKDKINETNIDKLSQINDFSGIDNYDNSTKVISCECLEKLEMFMKKIPNWKNNISFEITDKKLNCDEFNPLNIYGRKTTLNPLFYVIIGIKDNKQKIQEVVYLFDELVNISDDLEPYYVTLVCSDTHGIVELCVFIKEREWLNLQYVIINGNSYNLVKQLIKCNLLKTESFRIIDSDITENCNLFDIIKNAEIIGCNEIIKLKLPKCETLEINSCEKIIDLNLPLCESIKIVNCSSLVFVKSLKSKRVKIMNCCNFKLLNAIEATKITVNRCKNFNIGKSFFNNKNIKSLTILG